MTTIGFVGMTHLGLISGVSAAQKGFKTICFDLDQNKINDLLFGRLSVSEPQLDELIRVNSDHLFFTANIDDLHKCDVIYVASDVSTDDDGKSDLSILNDLLSRVLIASNLEATIVILSQVPPGFTRGKWDGRRSLYYQVETLIFGRAIERALYPERYIIGCANPEEQLPIALKKFLEAHNCPILPMRYESAELAKIAINMFLVSSVTTTNTLVELCEKIGANWAEIARALRLDRRIGAHAYLSPGLGISGGNLERDLATINLLSQKYNTEAGIVQAWMVNSKSRKHWPLKKLKEIIGEKKDIVIAIWGLAYKENTHSTKNSPSLLVISNLKEYRIRVFDPIVEWNSNLHDNCQVCSTSREAIQGADILMIMTPWKEFGEVSLDEIAKSLAMGIIIDPYDQLSNQNSIGEINNLKIYTLGR